MAALDLVTRDEWNDFLREVQELRLAIARARTGEPDPPALAREPEPRAQAKALKRALIAEKGASCEACGYAPATRRLARCVLHAHHVVPISTGGRDEASNLVVICANCHAVAHVLGTRRKGEWLGPRTREEFLAGMRRHIDDSAAILEARRS